MWKKDEIYYFKANFRSVDEIFIYFTFLNPETPISPY